MASTLSDKKESEVHVTELSTGDTLGYTSTEQLTSPAPVQSSFGEHPLAPEPVVERVMDIYDSVICLAPLLLIVKIVLCIVAYVKDKHLDADEVGQLTVFLVQFNSQVSDQRSLSWARTTHG